ADRRGEDQTAGDHELQARPDRYVLPDRGAHRPMRLLRLLVIAAVAVATASAAPPGHPRGAMTVGCVSASDSFNGQAYCLDGNHYPLLRTTARSGLDPADLDKDSQIIGGLELNGWQAPTRCSVDGVSGKREQLVYVHVQGAPSSFSTAQSWILQRLIPGANGVFEHTSQ